jgi:TM2 domain-containing membrane protein YozV
VNTPFDPLERRSILPPLEAPLKVKPVKSLRTAGLLNLLLPGAGQLYLGQQLFGVILLVLFLSCFVAALGIFLVGFGQYLKLALDGNILEGDRLERIGQVLHPRWLIGLAISGAVIYLVSFIGLSFAPRASSHENSGARIG